ncbi:MULTISPECIES: hypothetical protein [Actinopolyspora]|uniref:Uncharacterized protein n=1 Tax=Actinopolyspora saharensis TaxID=995062 RepID=A0A1H1GD37_9ACTN|nr:MULTISPECIES: hypothetical protein [Actinopolyspora]NHD16507.1 hypothetical protein [Actinopolyspora sp. BKK2]NHE75630.1 hypothetical protein [Actinopolyspora sp. BKK1]SDR11130.1 hypothetical protein SAMN04489718_3578 [Actinopolyspora saharensis]
MLKKVVLGLGVGWLVLVLASYGVLYGIGALNYTTLHVTEYSPERMTEQYHWDGGRIAISDNERKRGKKTGFVSCEVRPENGEMRHIETQGRINVMHRDYEPWFTGSATMTCRDQVTVRSGTTLRIYELVNSRLGQLAFAVVGAVPFILALIWSTGLVRIRRR